MPTEATNADLLRSAQRDQTQLQSFNRQFIEILNRLLGQRRTQPWIKEIRLLGPLIFYLLQYLPNRNDGGKMLEIRDSIRLDSCTLS